MEERGGGIRPASNNSASVKSELKMCSRGHTHTNTGTRTHNLVSRGSLEIHAPQAFLILVPLLSATTLYNEAMWPKIQ